MNNSIFKTNVDGNALKLQKEKMLTEKSLATNDYTKRDLFSVL